MKLTKYLFTIAVASLLLADGIQSACAQKAALYPLLTGGTTRILAASTNVQAIGLTSTNTYGAPGTSTNLAMTVGNFDYVGLTWAYTGGSNSTLLVYGSYDNGLSYNTNVANFTYASPTATAGFLTNASLDVHGMTHLAFVIRNAGTVDLTNATLEVNCKATTIFTKPANQ